MKNCFVKYFLFGIIIPTAAFAQKPIVVEEVIKEMSKGMQSGFEVLVPEVTLREIKSDLSKYIRKGSRGKVEEKNGETFITGAVNKNISPDLFTVYVKRLEVDDGVKLTAFFTADDTLFFTTSLNPDQGLAIKKYLKDFAVAQYRELVSSELGLQQRKLQDMEMQFENLVKAKQKSERTINESKRTIELNKKEIVQNNFLDSLKAIEVLNQRQAVYKIKNSGTEEEKLESKKLKSLESEKRKLEKEKETLELEIDLLDNRIEDEQRAIENNLKLQEEKNKEIEKQKNKVALTEEKLSKIV